MNDLSYYSNSRLAIELRKRGFTVVKSTIKRKSNGKIESRKRKDAIYAVRKEAYKISANDREAAELLGMQLGSFSVWRRSSGLKPKG